MTIFLIDLLLAVIFFVITNWIGKHSIQLGYMHLSVSVASGESPLFNIAYRVFSPIALVVLAAAFFSAAGLNEYIDKTYLVVAYYFAIRILFNLISQRTALVNWSEMLLIGITSIGLSYLVDKNMVGDNSFLFPSRQEIGSAVWLAIAAYLYKTINSVKISSNNESTRIQSYIQKRLDSYRGSYGEIIHKLTHSKDEKDLIWSVMIYEGFNRPAIYRVLERLVFPSFKRIATLGPMQVRTYKSISDEESVYIGASKVIRDYRSALSAQGPIDNPWELETIRRKVTSAYNSGRNYSEQVESVYQVVQEITGPELEPDTS
jgi:hypothetical protein